MILNVRDRPVHDPVKCCNVSYNFLCFCLLKDVRNRICYHNDYETRYTLASMQCLNNNFVISYSFALTYNVTAKTLKNNYQLLYKFIST